MDEKIIDGVTIRAISGALGYFVGEDGSVWSNRLIGLKRYHPDAPLRKLKLSVHWDGRLHVTIKQNGRRVNRMVHHLVLEAFVGPRPNGMECLHGDLGPKCNMVGNVRWGTSEENRAEERERRIFRKSSF